jgi:hypothetical protein
MRCKSVRQLSPTPGFLFVFLLLLYFGASAQSAFKGFSVNPKAGIYSHFNENQGFGGGIALNRFIGNTIYSVEYLAFGEFTLMDPVPDDVFHHIGFMAGRYTNNTFFRIEYQGGIAPFFGKRYSESVSGTPGTPSYRYYEEEKFFTLGLAAKLGLKILPFKHMGVGLDIHANLNLKRTVFFPCFSLEIGRLKN